MQIEFFATVFDALIETNTSLKQEKVKILYQNFNTYSFNHQQNILALQQPSFANLCKIIHPTRIQRPKEGSSNTALAKILHSIAHIEYNAIDLGLDAAYRFRNLPQEYYYDFIELAYEEVIHFNLLESLLQQLGFQYGDFAVHDNLFCAMQSTQNFIERMALVHAGLEALGLDANPFVYQKIQKTQTPIKQQILQTLERILQDEITHVSKGIKWLKYGQDQENDTRSLSTLISKFEFNAIGKIPNIEARTMAGYSMQDIEELQNITQYTKK